ncbi:RNI-like protein [Basidiobolus meristosporus CBS 931.73]|uniref:RNI-like protein n=1 Tax=Basidiobolus meristosporus CBS 931.73 TaxID=1314790 RepID=A0A1Y1ZE97_9FUNG|nr:RNI-like protein [Basidiobolus meristosporus CBS 931.73]|eukprot:ORY08145.1 RNI-like protein [Basidiobolus meristosporus CBS 931.73]
MLVQSPQTIHLLPHHSQPQLQLYPATSLFEEKYSYQTNTTCRDFNDPLERLPSEIRVRIFKLLDIRNLVKSSKVCRNWKKVAFDGSLWETIDLTRYYKRIASEQIVNLCCAAGGFLKTANFRGCSQLTSQELRVISDYCCNIQMAHFHGCRSISRESISYFIGQCSDLRVLNISGLSCVDDRFLEILGKRCASSLKQVDISRCRNATSMGLLDIIQRCTQLDTLRVDACVGVDDSTLLSISRLTGIKTLSLGSCYAISDEGVIAVAKGCTQLSSINLSGCRHLTNDGVQALGEFCSRLVNVDLSGCSHLSDGGLLGLVDKVPKTEKHRPRGLQFAHRHHPQSHRNPSIRPGKLMPELLRAYQ